MESAHMADIPIGTKGESQTEVTSDIAITFLDIEDARVLSTPRMIGLMEKTCRDAVLPLLESGYDTVGTHVNVAHLAAAPMGSRVTFRAEVIGVNDRRVEFRVEASTEREKIGEGTHQRTIINVAKFAAKQAQKKR
jgi:fluoroacetyl-CoA thioesterase